MQAAGRILVGGGVGDQRRRRLVLLMIGTYIHIVYIGIYARG